MAKNIYIFLTCRTLLYWVGFIEIQYQIHTREMSFIHDSCLDFGADRSLNIYLANAKNQILGT